MNGDCSMQTKVQEMEIAFELLKAHGCLYIPFDDNDTPRIVRRRFGGKPAPDSMFRDKWGDITESWITWNLADQLIESGKLICLTRRRWMHRIGWEETGLDGRNGECWVISQ